MSLPVAATETTPVLLFYNNAFLEVDSSLARRRGGLRTVSREAEIKWDLEPGSYDILHASEKMDSALDLQRALEATETGLCKLQVVERPEGKMMRKMRAEMKLMEKRLTAKVDESLQDLHSRVADHDAKLDGVIAPMVQSIAIDHVDLRNTLEQLRVEVADHDSKLDGVMAPMVQSIAMDHIDLRNTLDQLRIEVADRVAKLDGVIAPMVQSIAMDHIDLRHTLEQLRMGGAKEPTELKEEQMTAIASELNRHENCNALKKLEELEIELQQECAARAEHELRLHQEAYNEKELENEVRCLEDVRPSFLQPAAGLNKKMISETKVAPKNRDAWLQWPTQPLVGFSYSGKSKAVPWSSKWLEGQEGQAWSYGDVASFAQYSTLHTRSNKQVIGCRSCPLLPPLQ